MKIKSYSFIIYNSDSRIQVNIKYKRYPRGRKSIPMRKKSTQDEFSLLVQK